jgi:hypothetical protein
MIEINSNNYFKYPEKEFYYSNFSDEKENFVFPVKVKVKKIDKVLKNSESFEEFDSNYYYYFMVISLDNKKVYWSNQKDIKSTIKLFENMSEAILAFKNGIHGFYRNHKKVYTINDFPQALDEITFCGKKNIRNELVNRLNEFEYTKTEEKARKKIKEFM